MNKFKILTNQFSVGIAVLAILTTAYPMRKGTPSPTPDSSKGSKEGEIQAKEGDESQSPSSEENSEQELFDSTGLPVEVWELILSNEVLGASAEPSSSSVPEASLACKTFNGLVKPSQIRNRLRRGISPQQLKGLIENVNSVSWKDTIKEVRLIHTPQNPVKNEHLGLLSHFSFLTKLTLSNCPNLATLNGLPGCSNLEILDLSGCRNISSVSSVACCPNLRILDLSGCKKFTDVSSFVAIPSLRELHLGESGIAAFSEAMVLPELQVLDLSYTGIKEDSFKHLPENMRVLDLSGCWNVTDFGLIELGDRSVSEFKNLKEVCVKKYQRVSEETIKYVLGKYPNLIISISDSISDTDLRYSHMCLSTQNLSECAKITDLEDLSNLGNLAKLDLRECTPITDDALQHLCNLGNLTTLNLRNPTSIARTYRTASEEDESDNEDEEMNDCEDMDD